MKRANSVYAANSGIRRGQLLVILFLIFRICDKVWSRAKHDEEWMTLMARREATKPSLEALRFLRIASLRPQVVDIARNGQEKVCRSLERLGMAPMGPLKVQVLFLLNLSGRREIRAFQTFAN